MEKNRKYEMCEEELLKKEKNKKISIIGIVLIILLTIVVLTFFIVNSSSPKQTVDGYLTNMREGDFEKAKEFTKENIGLFEDSFDDETQRLLFDKLNWKVKKIEKDQNTATVELEITNKDFKKVIENYIRRVNEVAKAFLVPGRENTQIDFDKYFNEELKNDKLETITSVKNIELEKIDDKWKIVVNEKLVDALIPNFVPNVY